MFQLKHSVLFSPQTILITGASSGIGQALACAYANVGKTLLLWGRSEEKLKKTAVLCKEKGANVHLFMIDLSDSTASLNLLEKILEQFSIDMAIFAAGSGDIKNNHEILENSRTLQMLAYLNYLTPALMGNRIARQMIEQKIKGQLVFIGSVAAFHSLPFATGYSSSKAAITKFADSLRIAVKKYGVRVNLIIPGFIDTPMSQRLECSKPFLMPLDRATAEIMEAIRQNKRSLILPKLFIALKWIDLLTPACIRDLILSRIKVKQD